MTPPEIRYLSNDHYDVIVEACALHPNTNQVLLLSLVGEPDAMKAIQATLSLHLPFTITGFRSCIWPNDVEHAHTKIQRRLSAGAQATLWLPQQGTSVGIQHDTHAYIISRTLNDTDCPPTFFHILDRVFACPIREEWTSFIWEESLRRGWVKLMNCYNCTVWELQPRSDELIEWTQQQLRSHALPLHISSATSIATSPS